MKLKKLVILVSLVFVAIAVGAAVKNVHTIDAKLCTNCGECEKVCPEDAISEGVVNGKKVRVIDPKLCTNCGECVKVCPEDCISEIPYDKAVGAKAATKPAATKADPKKATPAAKK